MTSASNVRFDASSSAISLQEVDSQFKLLVAKRGLLKTRVTKFKTFLNNYNRQITPVFQIELRLTKIQESWDEFQNIQFQLELLDATVNQEAERDSFEDSYFDVVSAAHILINGERAKSPQHSSSRPSSPRADSLPISRLASPTFNEHHQRNEHHQQASSPPKTNNAPCNIQPTNNSHGPEIRLPILSLPTFDGTYESWPTFQELFTSMIHNNTSLSPIVKFHYLRSSLSGEAAAIIDSINLSHDSYSIAWSLLTDRFQNKNLIIQRHVRDLVNLSKIEKPSAVSLHHLINGTLKHIRSLTVLGQPTDSWDTLLVHLLASKLDPITFKEWTTKRASPTENLPSLNDFISFLQGRCHVLEAIASVQSTSKVQTNVTNHVNKPQPSKNFPSKTAAFTSTSSSRSKVDSNISHQPHTNYFKNNQYKCILCDQPHQIFACTRFLDLSIDDRWKKIQTLNICTNCLRAGHKTNQCRSSNCKRCGKHHNTLLHKYDIRASENTNMTSAQSSKQDKACDSVSVNAAHIPTQYHSKPEHKPSHVLLSTAQVHIVGNNGRNLVARALLDSGSQSSFITQDLCKKLFLRPKGRTLPITGIGATQTHASACVEAVIKSLNSSFSEKTKLIVLEKITNDIPTTPFNISNWNIPPHITLADPQFNNSSQIDLLIGADLFWDILGQGELPIPGTNVKFRESQLGWIVVGRIHHVTSDSQLCFLSTQDKIDSQMRQFWELEEISSPASEFSKEDTLCESHFKETFSRSLDGNYTVSLPFKIDSSQLGESRENALKRFFSLERRLTHNKHLQSHYIEFMREYSNLGHMKELSSDEIDSLPTNAYFVPHHPVFKNSSTTTKVRVVFDASAKTSSGLSLNDILLKGPVVQEELFNIITRVRLHNIIICADIEKMYRQIRIHPSQGHFLLIYWRENINKPLKIYALQTVTYGTTCAPFQAIRTLHQLAYDEEESYPTASKIILHDFYVDDLMTGCSTIEQAVDIYQELSAIMKRGGLHLRKWITNSTQLLDVINPTDRATQSPISIDHDTKYKTLGLTWDPSSDIFCFSISIDQTTNFTKRKVLSAIARIFDPLGLLGPLISRAKVFMQRLWTQPLQWDDTLQEPLISDWIIFYHSLQHINQLAIPRQITVPHAESLQLHGFSDASEIAYGACVYMRTIDNTGSITVRLISSKSRVAPLKSQSIPRLELCGALLLATLICRIQESFKTTFTTYLWTDSTIVLHWISSSPTRWTTFVRNRVACVQDLTSIKSWRHISGKDNPADLISRGLNGDNLQLSALWWQGPSWLIQHDEFWINSYPVNLEETQIPDQRSETSIVMSTQTNHTLHDIIHKYSYTRMIHTTAYCLRFFHNARSKSQSHSRIQGPLTPSELEKAQHILISFIQRHSFSVENKDLTKHGYVAKNSKLVALSPYIDSLGLIRVGGRLQNSDLTPDQIHPIILPSHHRFTEELIKNEHKRLLHAGPQSLLNSLRQRFWPLNGRNQVRKVTRSCLQCFRARPKIATQLMGQLPRARVQPSRPFLHTGVDYCGPVYVKMTHRRGCVPVKAYIALFICFATKAMHLELVEDMSSKSFISAMRRFISRRGKPVKFYSDNGTNFVGAHRELNQIDHISNSEDRTKVKTFSTTEGISWSFLPPNAPNFGGLWESGVKLVKYHLKRVLNNTHLTFIQFTTLLTQIESCINSRPITALSSDPSDLIPLTPAHFIIHDTFHSLPEPNLKLVKENRLDRWERAQQIVQHFWSRWHTEYIHELQQRTKWRIARDNIQLDTLALIKDDNTPPMTWRLGRVVEVHPGPDNLVRVVTLKTKSGLVKRPITKVCPLPSSDDTSTSDDISLNDNN